MKPSLPFLLLSATFFTGTYVQAQTSPDITCTIRDFGPRGFDYSYGPAWKNGGNITPQGDGVLIDTNEAGGAGMVLNGFNMVPQGQTHLAVRAKLMEGNAASQLQINLNGPGANKSVTLKLSAFKVGEYTTVVVPLPDGKFNNVAQIQVQGTNWGGGQPVKVLIDKLGITTPDPAANAEAAAKAAETIKNNPRAGAPAPDKPSIAGWGYYPAYPDAWMNMHQGFVARTKEGAAKKDINVVFLGDSITQGWGGEGKDVWAEKIKPLGAVNYGIGGDSTRQILWRLDNGTVDGIAPKVVVLMIGTNNLYGDFNAGSESEIADGIGAVVKKLQEKLPTSKILLMGILPRQNAFFSGRIAKINAQISKLADDKNVRFLDLSSSFATIPEKGEVIPDLYGGDKLHLVKKGYEVWGAAIQPVLQEMLQN
jgi:beta-glucosidase